MDETRHSRTLIFLAGFGLATAVAIMVLRIFDAFSFVTPYQMAAGGFEEESLFAIWKVVNGKKLYADPFTVPYAASYFNWGFYHFYGLIVGLAQDWLDLDDNWIPMLCRWVSLAGCLSGFFIALALYRKTSRKALVPAVLFAGLLFLGPLVGYWAVAVRPDVWATALEALAILVLLHGRSRDRLLGVLAAAVLCYLAWSFKQTAVAAPVAICLFLIWRRRFNHLFVVVGVFWALVGISFQLGDEQYRSTILLRGSAVSFSPLAWLVVLVNFAIKALPAWAHAVGPVARFATNGEYRYTVKPNDAFVLGLCGLAAWAVLLLPASAKVGAAENYHFSALLFLGLIASATFEAQMAARDAMIRVILFGGWALFAGASLYGVFGGAKLSLLDSHEALMAEKECIERLATPVFTYNRIAALPWINPSPPYLVRAYNYEADRAAGKPFKDGGIGGLIAEGYFGALLLPKRTDQIFDDVRLIKYQRQLDLCANRAVYLRKPDS